MSQTILCGKALGGIPALFLVVIGAMPAFAAELPTRKAGLWEMKMTASGGHSTQMQQCVDAKTDRAMQERTGTGPHGDCSKRDVQTSGTTTTIDSVCTMAGKSLTSHVVITGSFDSDYTMTITSQGEAVPSGRTMTMTAKWLGPCAADQRPGDMIMANGMKMNLFDLQKGIVPPGAPGH